MSRLKLYGALTLAILLYVFALLVVATVISSSAHAQIGGQLFSERSSSSVHGLFRVAFNTTGTEIPDGTLVMSDTAGVTVRSQVAIGKGIKTWSANTGDVFKVMGILIGNCPGQSQCKVLIEGFTPTAKVDATGLVGFSILRPSFTHPGRLHSWVAADSASTITRPRIAMFQRYAFPDSLIGFVEIKMSGMR